MGRRILLGLGALLLAGCDPRVFDDFESEAPVVAIERPDDYGHSGFGEVLGSTAGLLGDTIDASRILVSAGVDSPVSAFPVWTDGVLAVSGQRRYEACADGDGCAMGRGAAFAGIPRFGAHNGCVVLGAPTSGVVRIACEDDFGAQLQLPPMGDEDVIRLGASVAAIPTSDDLGADLSAGTVPTTNPAGVAFLGAPDADGEAGRIYRLPDGTRHQALDLSAALLPAMGHAGEALAAALLPDDGSFTTLSQPVLLVVGAPDAERVVLAAVGDDVAGASGIQTEVLGCLDSASPGFGGVVATADTDGDGIPEVYVSARFDVVGRAEEVAAYVLDPLALGGAVGCDGATAVTATSTLACPADAEGTSCLGFGASLASGSVDGDAYHELVVGAALSAVDANARAGAGYLFPGTATGLDAAAVDVLRHAHPVEGGLLGAAATMALSQLGLPTSGPRSEPVLGAPGDEAAYVFLCSALPGDTAANGERCVAAE